ncbi:hypothetical protein Tco_0435477 [Tanacetum coccineum]
MVERFIGHTVRFRNVKYYETKTRLLYRLQTLIFPAISHFYNTLTSDTALPCEPTISPPNENKIDFRISLDKSDDEDYTIWHHYHTVTRDTHGSDTRLMDTMRGSYTVYEQRLETIWSRPVNRVHVLDFTGLTPEMRQDLGVRLRMVYTRGEGQMSDTEIGLDVADTLCFQLRGAPEKVTGVDLFYLRSMDRGTANVPHLLAQYLFRHAEGRKSGARLYGGHFVRCLAVHFGLVSDEGLRGLHVADEAGLAADEDAHEIPTPSHAPLPPPPAPQPRTMSRMIERIEEEMRDL